MSSTQIGKAASADTERSARARVLWVSIAVLVFCTASVVAITMWVMYQTMFERAGERLQEVAIGRARLVGAVAAFDARHQQEYPEGPRQATLDQIVQAHERFPGFGDTGEFTMGRRRGNQIVFLLSRRHATKVERDSVPWESTLAEPMRRALLGQSGTLIGEDYRGAMVLAAHEPVPGTDWGVVAKMDVAEIRGYFVRAGLAAIGLGALAIALGVLVLWRVVSPIIERLGRRTGELKLASEERARAERQLAEARSLLITSISESADPRSVGEAPPIPQSFFRALACDYDGTLTTGGRPGESVLDALRRARDAGLKLILATGRTMSDLEAEFPDVDNWFDLIVAENGAVLHRQRVARVLPSTVSWGVDAALRARGVPFERGQVSVSCDAIYAPTVLEEVSRLQLDCQIIRNRGAIMVLPAGVTKGTGVASGLDALGVSPHNTVAVGDAENDLSMFESCELGVAVSNALPSLKADADLVLDLPAGEGVRALLDSPWLLGEGLPDRGRWTLRLGHTPEGAPVVLPAAPSNVLITGGSGSGKSFSSGLFAEQLIELGYSVCVFDPEGEHAGLGRFREVFMVGGGEPLPPPQQIARIIQHRFGSVVVDLSLRSAEERDAYTTEALRVLRAQRSLSGVPHWIIADEAHGSFGAGAAARALQPGERGYCLVTYRPAVFRENLPITFDFILAIPGGEHADEVAETAGMLTDVPPEALDRFLRLGAQRGQALLLRVASRTVEALTLAPRALAHVRHQRKYADVRLPEERHFVFRTPEGPSGAAAGNIEEFCREVAAAEHPILIHHAKSHDFSSWIAQVIRDHELALRIHRLESRIGVIISPDRLRLVRNEIIEAIRARYLV